MVEVWLGVETEGRIDQGWREFQGELSVMGKWEGIRECERIHSHSEFEACILIAVERRRGGACLWFL